MKGERRGRREEFDNNRVEQERKEIVLLCVGVELFSVCVSPS
jgi:hypothetical protein